MLNKEIFGFLSRIYYSMSSNIDPKLSISDFFCFANDLLENAKMQHIADNKRNHNRYKQKIEFLVIIKF